MRFGFAIDNRACIGCHACTVACKAEHATPIGVNRTWVKYIEKGEFPATTRAFSVQRCNHCDDAPCVEICPVTSLFKRDDGIVDFDSTRCIGCTACMQACPYDALHVDPATNTAAKCNYCTHRVDQGYEPACVVVCPVEAIVSGDLDDPNGRLGRLDRTLRVQYPKVEKNTKPKLFYIGGETASLDPVSAAPAADYLWSGADVGISAAALTAARNEAEPRARRVYDAQAKPGTWGWMVSAYITTKAIAAGTVLALFILFAAGRAQSVLPGWPAMVSLISLAVTGGLLVGDLKRPDRFLYILLRPQWKSWLVRGAYILTGFAVLTMASAVASLMGAGRGVQLAVGGLNALLATGVATYTAFLLAQAKGRDYWQNPLFVVSMLIDALLAGVVVFTCLGPLVIAPPPPDPRTLLAIGLVAISILLLAEHLPAHGTRNAAVTARLILRGRFALLFWVGGVGLGIVLPALMLSAGVNVRLAGFAVVCGMACRNHVLVQAPQAVPLS